MSSQKIDTLPPIVEAAIGKRLVCYDRVPRRVEEIVNAFQKPWFYIINEHDPDSNMGHYISAWSLTIQMEGHPPPPKDIEDHWIEKVKLLKSGRMNGNDLESWMRGEFRNLPRLEVEKE